MLVITGGVRLLPGTELFMRIRQLNHLHLRHTNHGDLQVRVDGNAWIFLFAPKRSVDFNSPAIFDS